MSDEKQEGQKTIVSFIVGLLIGGLLVWAFSSPADDKHMDDDRTGEDAEEVIETEMETTEVSAEDEVVVVAPTLPVGDGSVTVANQAAGTSIALTSATYPVSEGWIGVRDYNNGQLGSLLGVARFSESQGLVPSAITLQRSTEQGRTYAVVVYTESGDRQFNLADDTQIDSVFATFTAQ